MKRRLFAAVVATCLFAGFGNGAEAAPLEVNFIVSGLELDGPAALGSFDLTVLFDPEMTVQSWQFGDQLDFGVLGNSFQFVDDSVTGQIFFGEVSLIFDLSSQLDSFTLASIFFDVPGGDLAGAFASIQIDPTFSLLGDAFGEPLSLALVQLSSPDLPATAVPEPSTLLLLGSGAATLISRRARRTKA